ncbi:plantaricin C family lantibiotic [Streptosporangium algeriense]|uniref:Plantaricin C family lantibiotic n=1 Tax=Streptosporangium algeriense TaxID=1682748 RepID=A0ABW3DIU6_9ACTN
MNFSIMDEIEEQNLEELRGGAFAMQSGGRVCTISAECNGGTRCDITISTCFC